MEDTEVKKTPITTPETEVKAPVVKKKRINELFQKDKFILSRLLTIRLFLLLIHKVAS